MFNEKWGSLYSTGKYLGRGNRLNRSEQAGDKP